jgi:KH domain
MVNQETSRYTNMTTSYSRLPPQSSFAVMSDPGLVPERPVLAVPIGAGSESPMWDAASEYSNQFASWKRSISSPDLDGDLMWDQRQGPHRIPPESAVLSMYIRQPSPAREPGQHFTEIFADGPPSFPAAMPSMMSSSDRGRLPSATSSPMYLMPPAHPNHSDRGSVPSSLSAPDLLAIRLQESLRLEPSPSLATVDYAHFTPQLPQPTPPGFTAQILVADSLIGSILGRGGRTLNELQMHSGARIRISQRGEFFPGTRDRIVTIRGPTTQSVSLAQYLMSQRMVPPPTASYSGQPPFHSPSMPREHDEQRQSSPLEYPSQQRDD